MLRLKRLFHLLFRRCDWEEYDEHVRWCIGCGWLQLNANYPLRTEEPEWMFPLNDEEMQEYFETPEEERYLSEALFAYLNRMEELGLRDDQVYGLSRPPASKRVRQTRQKMDNEVVLHGARSRLKAREKGYIDVELMCRSVGHKVTIRCTREGVIVCKYPWQKCKPRKENADRDHCSMTRLIEDIPREVERMKREQQESLQKALLTWFVFKRAIERKEK